MIEQTYLWEQPVVIHTSNAFRMFLTKTNQSCDPVRCKVVHSGAQLADTTDAHGASGA